MTDGADEINLKTEVDSKDEGGDSYRNERPVIFNEQDWWSRKGEW